MDTRGMTSEGGPHQICLADVMIAALYLGGPSLFVLFVRFVLWAAISIPIVWAVQAHTRLLDADPILWFSMMLVSLAMSVSTYAHPYVLELSVDMSK